MQNSSPTPVSNTLPLGAIGTTGAALAFVILGASVLLRLTTTFDPSGTPVSTLPADIEHAVRLTHRITASSVGLIAIALVLLCWLRKAAWAPAFKPTAGIVGATVLLAAIGPLTPGYRYASVTVANVLGGSILLMAFWWLRVLGAKPASVAKQTSPVLTVALLMFLVQVATGAAASAFEARGVHWVAYLHIGSAVLFLIAAGEILWARPHQGAASRRVKALTGILLLQIALGLLLVWLHEQPVILALAHALVSQLFAAGLVSVCVHTPLGPPEATPEQ